MLRVREGWGVRYAGSTKCATYASGLNNLAQTQVLGWGGGGVGGRGLGGMRRGVAVTNQVHHSLLFFLLPGDVVLVPFCGFCSTPQQSF